MMGFLIAVLMVIKLPAYLELLWHVLVLGAAFAYTDGLDWQRSLGERRGTVSMELFGVYISVSVVLYVYLFPRCLTFLSCLPIPLVTFP